MTTNKQRFHISLIYHLKARTVPFHQFSTIVYYTPNTDVGPSQLQVSLSKSLYEEEQTEQHIFRTRPVVYSSSSDLLVLHSRPSWVTLINSFDLYLSSALAHTR